MNPVSSSSQDNSTIVTNNAGTGATGGTNAIRLQLGMFTISPASGVVLPGGSIQINVDMFSELSSVCEEVSIPHLVKADLVIRQTLII